MAAAVPGTAWPGGEIISANEMIESWCVNKMSREKEPDKPHAAASKSQKRKSTGPDSIKQARKSAWRSPPMARKRIRRRDGRKRFRRTENPTPDEAVFNCAGKRMKEAIHFFYGSAFPR
jgi:hypothetical protein